MEPRISSLVDTTQLGRELDSSQASLVAFPGVIGSPLALQPNVYCHNHSYHHCHHHNDGANHVENPTQRAVALSSEEPFLRKSEDEITESTFPLTEVLHPGVASEKSNSFRPAVNYGTKSSQEEGDNANESSGTKNVITLPEPKSARKGTKRPRIPPLLQGLHQPPPDAGLFPPITANSIFPAQNVGSERSTAETQNRSGKAANTPETEPRGHSTLSSRKTKVARQRRKWSDEETKNLLRGVTKYGIGRWKEILLDPDLAFNGRIAVDLKDRFRTCFPDEYRKVEQSDKNREDANCTGEGTDANKAAEGSTRGVCSRFPRSQRRARRKFTEEDDASLVKGHAKYGALWHKIRDDPDLNLSTRKATDLRDRLRNLHPELFIKSDFQGNPRASTISSFGSSEPSNLHSRVKETATHEDRFLMRVNPINNASSAVSQSFQSQETLNQSNALASFPFLTDIFSIGDDANFFEASTSPIILSRTILDWGEHNTHIQGTSDAPATGNIPITEQPQGIDPLMTVQGYSSTTALPSLKTNASVSSLPGIAAIAMEHKSEAFNLPPLSETLMPLDMTVDGLMWDEYE